MRTNRKGFLKRTGLAIASVFTLTSAPAAASAAASGKTEQPSVRTDGQKGTTPDAHGLPSGAIARVRTAKGAVARQSGRF